MEVGPGGYLVHIAECRAQGVLLTTGPRSGHSADQLANQQEEQPQGSLLERLVGAAYAAHIRAREAEKAAKAEEAANAEPLMNGDEARGNGQSGTPSRRLLSRNGYDWTRRFPLIRQACEALRVRSCLVDYSLALHFTLAASAKGKHAHSPAPALPSRPRV